MSRNHQHHRRIDGAAHKLSASSISWTWLVDRTDVNVSL